MTRPDAVVTLGRSLVQHGPHSDRVYLMRLAPEDCPGIVAGLDRLAAKQGYSKIFAKVPESLVAAFHQAGYVSEALAPGFYPGPAGQGRENGHFLGRFTAPWRAEENDAERVLAVLRAATVKGRAEHGRGARHAEHAPKAMAFERLGPEDAPAMAALYASVFATYPFPIHDAAYIRATMDSHVIYYGLRVKTKLVALGSCEIDALLGLVEMTDFATAPGARGAGIAQQLLAHMEREMFEMGLHMAYTIARARSFGMNVSFARRSFSYAGTLIRNTNISGSLESMNVWFKALHPCNTQAQQ